MFYATGILALWPTAVLPQAEKRRRRVAILVGGTVALAKHFYDALKDEMAQRGWREGVNVEYMFREGQGDNARVASLAAELVAEKPDVILAPTAPGAVAVRKHTSTIPIVFVLVPDPVKLRLVANLARPGGNATGTVTSFEGLRGKRLQLLQQTIPSVQRLGLFYDPGDAVDAEALKQFQAAARELSLEIQPYHGVQPEDIKASFAAMKVATMDAVVLGGGIANYVHRKMIADLALEYRLPLCGASVEYAEAGALMTYSMDAVKLYRIAARYIDRILRGTRPADLPIEQPVALEFVINLKTAKALGVTIPQSLLVRATRVIE